MSRSVAALNLFHVSGASPARVEVSPLIVGLHVSLHALVVLSHQRFIEKIEEDGRCRRSLAVDQRHIQLWLR